VTRMSYASTSPARTRSTSSVSSISTTGAARPRSSDTVSTAGAGRASVARARTLRGPVRAVSSTTISRYHLAEHLLLLRAQHRADLPHRTTIDTADVLQETLDTLSALLHHRLALRLRHVRIRPLPRLQVTANRHHLLPQRLFPAIRRILDLLYPCELFRAHLQTLAVFIQPLHGSTQPPALFARML